MISAHDIIAFIEYEMSFRSGRDGDGARAHGAGSPTLSGRHFHPKGPDGMRHHRTPEDDDFGDRLRSERVS